IAPALQADQMRLADDPATAHPYFWGAFVLQGDGASRDAKTAQLR
ncbi:MAG: hypothetical protein IBJ15_11195, partial [Alphaproteobacteria bacterium]|nr:hypothetical protein [Alphaproteobacteria bacterium]